MSRKDRFNDYTNWEADVEGIGCPSDGCNSNTSLLIRADANYIWNAANNDEKLPYICVSRCSKGYFWHSSIGRCLRVHGHEEVSLGDAAVSCAAEGAALSIAADCDELNRMAGDIFKRDYAAGQRYSTNIRIYRGMHNVHCVSVKMERIEIIIRRK